ncbi:MAG: DUF1552 domain-containing protein [Deltaproteobacteria bacterium]|nr:DUF1552 domain-containing protein [Deltaproteobacteria bacterium]
MASNEVSRRLVLLGAGASVGLPWLPSLMSKAYGADAGFLARPRFVAFMTDHGGVLPENMFPPAASATTKEAIFGGHTAGAGPLKLSDQGGGEVGVCPVLRAPSGVLTPQLLSKINVVRGLDIPFYIAHNTGGHLGNYARNDGNGTPGQQAQKSPMPTIDQIMAWSPSFYSAGDLAGIKERSIVTGTRGGYSWNWSNPQTKSGTIQEIGRETSSLALFDKLFVKPSATPVAARKPIVDKILANYKSLRESDRRLSATDKQRLDDHIARLAELQRKVTTTAPTASCQGFAKPAVDANNTGGDQKKKLGLLNDVIVMAFMCGTTRVASMSLAEPLVPFSGSWHQDTAHNWPNPDAQSRLVAHNRNAFAWAFLDLARKLDVEEAGGRTFLDNTLIAWSQESGFNTHEACGLPLVTAGSAAGFFKTGQYIDYRNTGRAQSRRNLEAAGFTEYVGLTWNRWLATALQSMGVPRSEFEKPGVAGYGNPLIDGSYTGKYVSGVLETASNGMPLMQA